MNKKAHVSESKKKTVVELLKLGKDYSIIGLLNMENLPAKQLQKNRASYRSRYVGTTLQQINEERAAAAKERWKHLRVDSNHSTDTAPTKRGYSSAELTWSNSAKESRDRYYGYSDKKIAPPAYGYGDPPYEEKEKITYVVPYERKEPEYKLTGKFPKVEEAIRNAKKK